MTWKLLEFAHVTTEFFVMDAIRTITDDELEALWSVIDQTDVALIPALNKLSTIQPNLSRFIQAAVVDMKRGAHDAARMAAFEETKRRFFLSRRKCLDLTAETDSEDEKAGEESDAKRARVE